MMKISCPSKTFLTGEYAVIDGGPAILAATPPYFVLDNGVFRDPYQGAGGFGASGARFVLYLKETGCQSVWQAFRHYRHSGRHGSGADVVAQWMGGVTYFHAEKKIIESMCWPFPDLLIGLIHTGYKVSTYEHLQTLSRHHFPELRNIVLNTYAALKNKEEENFIQSIRVYGEELNNLELVCEHTQNLLEHLKKCPAVIAAKGCGALGADVILTLLRTHQRKSFLSWALEEKFNVVFCDNQFAGGILS